MARPPGAPAGPGFPPLFAVAVDLVALTVRDDALHVLLVDRGVEPYRGRPALPGGFVLPDEDLPDAAARELAEETGLLVPGGVPPGGPGPAAGEPRDAPGQPSGRPRRPGGERVAPALLPGARIPWHLEQLATYGRPDRDPRLRVVSVAYLALAPDLPDARAGSDAAAAGWVPVDRALREHLAFDHDRILRDGVERARAKLEYTSLAVSFCPPQFTVGRLRRVYEAVWGVEIDPRNFHRKVTGTPGLLVDTGATAADGPGRPAALYRAGATTAIHPPLTRDRLLRG